MHCTLVSWLTLIAHLWLYNRKELLWIASACAIVFVAELLFSQRCILARAKGP